MRVFEPKSENKKEQGDLLKEAELIKITEIQEVDASDHITDQTIATS